MNYEWARDFTLELINQYSVAGDVVAMSYNNQADYIARIPKLLDDAQMHIATTVRRIRAIVPSSQLESEVRGTWRVYTVPEDCWQMSSAGLVRFTEKEVQRYHKYRTIGAKQFAVPESLGEFSLEYFRYPKLLGLKPAVSAELDNTQEAQFALPYYAAAHLVMYDNAYAYGVLFNEWEGKLERLYELPQTELTAIEDAYSGAEWGAMGCE